MLEKLYENVGEKIKVLAVVLFAIESIGIVLVGIFKIFTNLEEIIIWLLIIALGIVVACIFSWLLYAFGELVEKTCENEANTRKIVNLLQNNLNNKLNKEEKTLTDVEKANNYCSKFNITEIEKSKPTHKWQCVYCEKMRSQSPCEHCGKI